MTKSPWHGKVARYPRGALVGPDCHHEGPEYIDVTRAGFYVWEYMKHPPFRCGPWTMHGPFRSQARALEKAAEVNPQKRDNP